MMKVMPYDPSHEEVYNANVYHENLNRTENRGFFCKTYRNRPTGNIL